MRAEQAQAGLRRPLRGQAKPSKPEAGHCRAPQRSEGILGDLSPAPQKQECLPIRDADHAQDHVAWGSFSSDTSVRYSA